MALHGSARHAIRTGLDRAGTVGSFEPRLPGLMSANQ
jgi:hypothetical protein